MIKLILELIQYYFDYRLHSINNIFLISIINTMFDFITNKSNNITKLNLLEKSDMYDYFPCIDEIQVVKLTFECDYCKKERIYQLVNIYSDAKIIECVNCKTKYLFNELSREFIRLIWFFGCWIKYPKFLFG